MFFATLLFAEQKYENNFMLRLKSWQIFLFSEFFLLILVCSKIKNEKGTKKGAQGMPCAPFLVPLLPDLSLNGRDARQGFSLQKFEHGATAGGHIADSLCQAHHINGSHRITTAD